MKKKLIGGVIVIAVVCIAIWCRMNTSVDKLIQKNLGTSNYAVTHIEEMAKNQDPTGCDIKRGSEVGIRLQKKMSSLKLRYIKTETGMEITDPLYTVTFATKDTSVTCTVNSNNELHVNQTEVTYVITSQTDLYNLLKKAYDESK